MWAGKRSERPFSPEDLLALDATLAFGAPVAYKRAADDESWSAGHLVYRDDKSAWLEGNQKVPVGLVKPIDVKMTFKAGDKVLAAPMNTLGTLVPGTVTNVLNGGLEYEIKGEDGQRQVASYCAVTKPIQ